jgi:methionine-rich copper-binding protein CopC
MITRMSRGRLGALTAITAVSLLLFPATAAAHAELDVPTPKDGATVEGTPPEVSGTFTQRINPDGSSMVLRDTNDKVVARGGPDPDDVKRMVITDLPELAPGTYEVQWTTISAEDDELARGTWSFTAAVALKTPETPAPIATASASAAATASATPEPTATPSPTASPAPADGSNASGGDVILPIIVALVLVLLAAGFLLSRRGRPSGGV